MLKSNYTFPNKVTLQSGFNVAASITSNFGQSSYINIDNYSKLNLQNNSTLDANYSTIKLDHGELNLSVSEINLNHSNLNCSGTTNINGNPDFNGIPNFKGKPRFLNGICFDSAGSYIIDSIRIGLDGKLKIEADGVSYYFTPDA